MHAVTRGQYEAIVPTDIFSEKFIQQLGAYLSDLRGQFSLPVAVLGFLPFCAWGLRFGGQRRSVFPVTLGLVLVGGCREILGSGTLFSGASLLLGPHFQFMELTILPGYRGFLLMMFPFARQV